MQLELRGAMSLLLELASNDNDGSSSFTGSSSSDGSSSSPDSGSIVTGLAITLITAALSITAICLCARRCWNHEPLASLSFAHHLQKKDTPTYQTLNIQQDK